MEDQAALKELLYKIQINPKNPRKITKQKEEDLERSLRQFPKMLELRPIVYDEAYIALGGNMRLLKLRGLFEKGEIVLKSEYFKSVSDLTPEEKEQFIIKDNVPFGDWDWDILKANWDIAKLKEWGMDITKISDEQFYNRNVQVPVYQPKNEKPILAQLVAKEKVETLLQAINQAAIPEDVKEFLRIGATRHYVFDYGRIADFYAHSEPSIQSLFEASALVIIDFNKAIELGYVELTKSIMEGQKQDYGEQE